MPDIAALGIVVETKGVTQSEQQLKQLATAGERTAQKAKDIAKAWGPALGAAVAAGATAAGAAVLKWSRDTARLAGEIEKLSHLSNATAAQFQMQAAAAQTVGLQNEKLADIFKDVNDKVGEFLQTGGGELKDFFDKIGPRVGVTAEQFRRLSGPDALQLYVSSLEKAGLNQAEMVFYLEAIADEASALLPLLRNNGRGMRELGNEAERLGGILDDQTIAASKALNTELWRLDQMFQGIKTQIAAQMVPVLADLSVELHGMAERGDLARNAADLLGAVLRGGVGLLREYENAVGRTSIAMQMFAETAAGAREVVANLGIGGLIDDGSIRGGFARIDRAFADGQKMLDAHMARMDAGPAPGRVPSYLQLPGYLTGKGPLPGIGAPLEPVPASRPPADPRGSKPSAKSSQAEVDPMISAYQRLNGQLSEQIALFGKTGEAAQLRYQLEEGELARMAPALKSQLLAKAEMLDFKRREADATAESVRQASEEASAREHGAQSVRDMISGMRFERDLIGLSNEDREVAIALRYAEAGATAEQRAEIVALARDTYQAREAETVLLDVKSSATDMFASFLDGSQSAGDAFEDFTRRLRRLAAQLLAEKAVQYVLSMFGGGAFAGNSATKTGGNYKAASAPGKFSSGGYTGPGGKHEPAGVVHKGEVVWSQDDVARAGGVGVVEAMRRGVSGYANGGIVGQYAAPMRGGGGGAPNIKIEMVNQGGQVQTKRQEVEQRPDGTTLVRLINQVIADGIGSGSGPAYAAMKGRFGLRDTV